MIVYNGKLLKKIFKLKIKARPVTTWLSNITFHLLPIGLQAVVAINSESCQTSFPSFCTPPSEVSVLCNLNVSRRPFLGQVAFRLRPIGLQTVVAIDSESCQTSFPSFCTPPSEVSVLFDSNLSRLAGARTWTQT